jgi:hypothetical protein
MAAVRARRRDRHHNPEVAGGIRLVDRRAGHLHPCVRRERRRPSPRTSGRPGVAQPAEQGGGDRPGQAPLPRAQCRHQRPYVGERLARVTGGLIAPPPKPLVWTAIAEEILEKVRRGGVTLEQKKR